MEAVLQELQGATTCCQHTGYPVAMVRGFKARKAITCGGETPEEQAGEQAVVGKDDVCRAFLRAEGAVPRYRDDGSRYCINVKKKSIRPEERAKLTRTHQISYHQSLASTPNSFPDPDRREQTPDIGLTLNQVNLILGSELRQREIDVQMRFTREAEDLDAGRMWSIVMRQAQVDEQLGKNLLSEFREKDLSNTTPPSADPLDGASTVRFRAPVRNTKKYR